MNSFKFKLHSHPACFQWKGDILHKNAVLSIAGAEVVLAIQCSICSFSENIHSVCIVQQPFFGVAHGHGQSQYCCAPLKSFLSRIVRTGILRLIFQTLRFNLHSSSVQIKLVAMTTQIKVISLSFKLFQHYKYNKFIKALMM